MRHFTAFLVVFCLAFPSSLQAVPTAVAPQIRVEPTVALMPVDAFFTGLGQRVSVHVYRALRERRQGAVLTPVPAPLADLWIGVFAGWAEVLLTPFPVFRRLHGSFTPWMEKGWLLIAACTVLMGGYDVWHFNALVAQHGVGWIAAVMFWHLYQANAWTHTAFNVVSLLLGRPMLAMDGLDGALNAKWERQRAWLLSRPDSLEFQHVTGLLPPVAKAIFSQIQQTPHLTLHGLRDFLAQTGRNPAVIVPRIIAHMPESVTRRQAPPAPPAKVPPAKVPVRVSQAHKPQATKVASGQRAPEFQRQGFVPYLNEQGVSLTHQPQRTPGAAERRVIVDLLKRLAEACGKPIDTLTDADFTTRVPLSDRILTLGGFFQQMERMNDTAFTTSRFILVRYGVLPAPSLASIDDFRRALNDGALRRDPWIRLGGMMERELIRYLCTVVRKPAAWLSKSDLEHTELPALSAPGRRFTLRNYALWMDKPSDAFIYCLMRWWAYRLFGLELPDLSPLTLRLKRLGLIAVGIRHPAQTLETPEALKEALKKEWMNNIRWDFISLDIQRRLVWELVAAAEKDDPRQLAAHHYEMRPIPTLMYTTVSGKSYASTLRGLYFHYENDPERAGMPVPAYILVALGLATREQVANAPRGIGPRLRTAV